jgi:hypothetical protein
MCYAGGLSRKIVLSDLSHWGFAMAKLIGLAIAGFAAGVFWLVAPQQVLAQSYRVAQADTFDSGRCFNRCIHRRGLRPASTRIGYCHRRCQ